ncbi:hypothetical protein PTKIN_Ptkin04bG0219500 [Pterospermum kingtungense]
MSLFAFVLHVNQDKPWNPLAKASALLPIDSPYLILKFALFFLSLFLLFIFLCVSFELPITIRPLRVSPSQEFSLALLLSLAASWLFPSSLFWFFFLTIIFTYPWHANIFDLFASCLRWFAQSLQSIPTYFIIITRNQQNPNQPPQAEL